MSGEPQSDGWIEAALDRYEGPLVSYATRLHGGDVERARDTVQEVFLRLVRADRAAIGDRVAVWLFHVCRNRALELCSREKAMVKLEERRLDAATVGPLEHLETQDEAARMRAEVERLPERERELLRLKFQHELSYQEMGAITGLSATNVGFLLHKAIRSLRERLSAAPGPVRNECAS